MSSRPATRDFVLLSLVWLALNAQWATVVPIVVPDQVGSIVGSDDPGKEVYNGLITAVGAVAALLVSPLAGALSDRSRNRRGRRRGFLVWGMAGSCAGLLLLLPFGPGSSIVLYGAVVLFLQWGWNWVAGAYAGLIPDVLAPAEQDRASAWVSIMTVVGTVLGNVLLLVAVRAGWIGMSLVLFVMLNLVTTAVILRGVREPVLPVPPPFALGRFLASFYIDPRRHRAFYQVLVTRLLANMGISSVSAFLLYYLGDVIGVARPNEVLPILLGLGALVAIPASLAGTWLAERRGIVCVTSGMNGLMALSAVGFVAVALWPSLTLTIPPTLLFAGSFGAYQALDWALALRVLPSQESAGKDMGIWHVCMVLPMVAGPAGTGWLISLIKPGSGAQAAYAVAFGLAAAWLALAAMMVRQVRLPQHLPDARRL